MTGTYLDQTLTASAEMERRLHDVGNTEKGVFVCDGIICTCIYIKTVEVPRGRYPAYDPSSDTWLAL